MQHAEVLRSLLAWSVCGVLPGKVKVFRAVLVWWVWGVRVTAADSRQGRAGSRWCGWLCWVVVKAGCRCVLLTRLAEMCRKYQ